MITHCGNPSTIQQLAEIVKFNPSDLFTPLNVHEVKQTFIRGLKAGVTVEPVFEYDDKFLTYLYEREDDLIDTRDLLMDYLSIDDPSTPIDHWLKNLIARRCSDTQDLLRLAYSISHKDAESTNSLLSGLYKAPSKQVIESARGALTFLQEHKKRYPIKAEVSPFTYRSQQIAATLQRLIDAYGFSGWKAEVNSLSTEVSTYAIGKKILIPDGLELDENELTKLAAREVECHIRGIINTEHLLYRLTPETEEGFFPIIPWLSKSIDEDAYQGVAKKSDIAIEANLTGNGSAEMPNPWYVLAIDYAMQDHSFGETGKWLFENMVDVLDVTPDEAAEKTWRITCRLFRGKSTRGRASRCCTADASRYSGYLQLNVMALTNPRLFGCVQNFSSLSLDELTSLSKACGEAGISIDSLFRPQYEDQHLSTKDTPIPGQTCLP